MNPTKTPLFSILCAAMLGGCGISGTVVDRMGFQTAVTNLRAEPAHTVRILLGDSMWDIPLKSIESLEVDSINYRTINGEIFFPAKINFSNRGTTPPPGKGKMSDSRIFICAGTTLVGKNKNGSFSISMDKVSKLNMK